MSKQNNINRFNEILGECSLYDFEGTTSICSPSTYTKPNTKPKIIITENQNIVIPNSVVHIFASGRRAGGGVENGANAQEEDISRKSSWYIQAKSQPTFYKDNTKNHLDIGIIAKDGKWFVDEYGQILNEPISINFIGVCAPNNHGLSSKNRYAILFKRWCMILNESSNISGNLITGAWGTGVFGNPSEIVAEALGDALEYTRIKTIYVCIAGNTKREIFEKILLSK